MERFGDVTGQSSGIRKEWQYSSVILGSSPCSLAKIELLRFFFK